jgi:Ulp1 family protease
LDRPAIKLVENCSQQENGADCGVYLLLFTDFLAQILSKDPSIETLEGSQWLENPINMTKAVSVFSVDC